MCSCQSVYPRIEGFRLGKKSPFYWFSINTNCSMSLHRAWYAWCAPESRRCRARAAEKLADEALRGQILSSGEQKTAGERPISDYANARFSRACERSLARRFLFPLHTLTRTRKISETSPTTSRRRTDDNSRVYKFKCRLFDYSVIQTLSFLRDLSRR